MYKIAVCDDEQKEIDKIVAYLKKYRAHNKVNFEIETFLSISELFCCINKGYIPDILLLDIYMQKEDGVQAAKKLRKAGFHNTIIFITTSKEHALEAYGVNAAQYLVKPLDSEKLFALLDELNKTYKKELEKYMIFRIDGMLQRILLCDIIYCEAQKNYQYIHFVDGSKKKIRITMTALYNHVSKWSEFVKVGCSYFVNLSHIKSLNSKEVTFSNGKMLYLPRGTYASLKELYFEYYCN
ncbi:MAG: response regulator transcription factor [Firmicutes bacterium]|nr:response regulator transcription factor [Bacillota bacterium]